MAKNCGASAVECQEQDSFKNSVIESYNRAIPISVIFDEEWPLLMKIRVSQNRSPNLNGFSRGRGGLESHRLYPSWLCVLAEQQLINHTSMQIVHVPIFLGYYVVPVVPDSLQNSNPTSIEPQRTQNQQNFTTLREAEREFERFLETISHLDRGSSDISYLDLSERTKIEMTPSLEELREIYYGGIQRYRTNYRAGKRKNSWGQDDIIVLLWILDKFFKLNELHPKDYESHHWQEVAKLIPFRTGTECMFKWLSLKKNRLGTNPWGKEEEDYLLQLVEQYDNRDWVQISKRLYTKFMETYRSPKQCREHWALCINSRYDRSKKQWTPEEDKLLTEHYSKIGRKWKMISGYLPGRSENAIKNRFNLLKLKSDCQNPSASQLKISEMVREQMEPREQSGSPQARHEGGFLMKLPQMPTIPTMFSIEDKSLNP